MCLGSLAETIGYAGRVMLNDNPYGSVGFQIQICCLIIAPAFFAAGIYLTLKHFVIMFGEGWSRLRPAWYTYIFIAGDIFSLVLQGAGGGIAATADSGSSMLDVGTNLMITGVIFQVVILFVFACLVVEYAIRTNRRTDQLSAEALALFHNTKFRLFVGSMFVAYLGIFTRCVYRIPELTGGWRSELMRNEAEFIALEGVMITLSVLVMTVFHPGFCFPALGNTIGKRSKTKTVDEEGSVEMMQN
jgi:preprotein translocase subunit SecG